MTVYINKQTDCWGHANKGTRCSFCGEAVFYPFLCWDTYPHDRDCLGLILLCSRCCHKIKKGLIADLIHLEAVAEIQKLYPEFTLVRESTKRLDERLQRVEEEWNKKILRQVDSGQ